MGSNKHSLRLLIDKTPKLTVMIDMIEINKKRKNQQANKSTRKIENIKSQEK